MFQSDGKLMMVQAQTNCILPFPNQGRNAWIMDQNLSETSVFFISAFQNSKMHSSWDFYKKASLLIVFYHLINLYHESVISTNKKYL